MVRLQPMDPTDFFDPIALSIDDREGGKLVPQIEANEKRAMLRHRPVLSSLHHRVRQSLGTSYEDEACYRRRTGLLMSISRERAGDARRFACLDAFGSRWEAREGTITGR
jgi:hypothetical protein